MIDFDTIEPAGLAGITGGEAASVEQGSIFVPSHVMTAITKIPVGVNLQEERVRTRYAKCFDGVVGAGDANKDETVKRLVEQCGKP